MKRWVPTLSLMLTVILASAALCNAQTASSTSIVGTIKDPQGAVVPNATVVAKNKETGIERTTTSTPEGFYRIPNLQPGIYDVRVESSGFATANAPAVKLQVGELRDVNFTLVVVGATTRIEVTSETPLVETTKTDVSALISDKEMAALPIAASYTVFGGVGAGASNDYANLAALAPGVKFDFSGNLFELVAPGSPSVRGIQVNVDSGNISDQVVSTRDALGASAEEIKEFQVLTNNYNAEYGQAGGVIINAITKSGTNQLHGDAHVYLRGRNLTASNFFYNLGEDSKFRRAPFQKQEGGFTAGGPIIKNRTFWFTSYEQTHQEVPLLLTPPTGTQAIPQPVNELLWSTRVDHELTPKHQISARFNVQRDTQDNQQVQVPSFASPESLVALVVHDHTLNLAMTSTLTPQMVNEGRFFWHHFLNSIPTKSDLPGQLGPNFYRGAAFCCPQGGLQNRFQYIDNLTWTHGTHTVKTGFNISHFPYDSLFQQYHFGRYEGFPGSAPNEGLPTQFTIGLGPGFVHSADDIYGFYVQDSWKLRSNLTVNYGLRYDLEVGAFQGGTQSANVPGGCVQGNDIIPACSSDHNNFQPRLGIAWSPRFQSGILRTLFGAPNKSVIKMSAAEVTQLAFLNIVLDSLNFDGTTLFTTTIKDPSVLKFYPNAPPASALAPFVPANRTAFGRVRPISNDLRNPETRQVNLTFTRQIGNDFVLDVGYLGVFGYGLFGERDRNFPQILADPAHPGFSYFGPVPDPRFGPIRTNENSRTSAYNGVFIQAQQRFARHLQFQVNYTYSRMIASTEDFYGTSEPGDPNNIRLERSLAQNDLRHQANLSLVYDTAQMFKMPILKQAFNNLQWGFAGQFQSGRPYPVSTGDAPYAGAFYPGVGAETQQRPSILPDGTLISTNIASSSGTNLLVSQAGAAACNCPQTTFLAPANANPNGAIDSFTGDPVDFQFINGNLGRNVGLGSNYVRLDLSITKSIRLKEDRSIELKADFFNVLNRTNFLLYNNLDTLNLLPVSADPNCRSCLNAHTGRYIGADGSVLRIQDLQSGRVSRDILNPLFGGLGDPLLADIPRTIQLAMRFRW